MATLVFVALSSTSANAGLITDQIPSCGPNHSDTPINLSNTPVCQVLLGIGAGLLVDYQGAGVAVGAFNQQTDDTTADCWRVDSENNGQACSGSAKDYGPVDGRGIYYCGNEWSCASSGSIKVYIGSSSAPTWQWYVNFYNGASLGCDETEPSETADGTPNCSQGPWTMSANTVYGPIGQTIVAYDIENAYDQAGSHHGSSCTEMQYNPGKWICNAKGGHGAFFHQVEDEDSL